jgi:N-acetylglucosaminyl-diphospho-decaprenol L-rhamnosyltransferase
MDSQANAPTLDIVIVNWNAGEQLRSCLNSIPQARKTGFVVRKVVVVDNASSDASATDIQIDDIPLVVIRNQSNRGFGAACNQGAHDSEADYLLFLNPDTLLYSETLQESIRFMEAKEHSNVGISTVKLIDDCGETARCCSRFPSTGAFLAKMLGLPRILPNRFRDHFYLEWDHQDTREVDQVMGAYLFIRRHLFVNLGGFDERFFVYFEDVDISLRARQLGWRSYHNSQGRAYHKGRGTSEQVRAKRTFYSLRSRIFYAAKHFTLVSTTLLFVATLLLEPFSRVLLGLLRSRMSEIHETLKAYGMLYANLPGILRTIFAVPSRTIPATSPVR